MAAAVMSRTSRDSLQTLRIASWAFASRRSILVLLKRFSALGMPVSDQSGWGIDLGTMRLGDRGYIGRTVPGGKVKVGKGLKWPVMGSGSETSPGVMILWMKAS